MRFGCLLFQEWLEIASGLFYFILAFSVFFLAVAQRLSYQ